MYAIIIECDMHAIASSDGRGQMERALATALGALPGFVAFVAFDADVDAGMVAALCLCDGPASLAAVQRLIAQWHAETFGAAEDALREIGKGAVIAQKGL
jgi:hypothetical protein